MKKAFNEDDLAIEAMEAPCRCNCGRWFDLEDGYPKNGSNDVICEVCYEEQELADLFCEDCGYVPCQCWEESEVESDEEE